MYLQAASPHILTRGVVICKQYYEIVYGREHMDVHLQR
jgi:hypothetical protein